MKIRMHPAGRARGGRKQSGAVLVVALLFLLIITMLGITTMQSTTSEERMAGNNRDWNNALQAAEAAMRDAWYDLNGQCAPINSATRTACNVRSPEIVGAANFGNNAATAGTCSATGLCLPLGTFPNYTQLDISTWSAVNPVTLGTYTMGTGDSLLPQVSQQPQYVIEAVCTPDSTASLGGVGCPNYYYRVTARGFGGNSNTQVTLQNIIRR